MDNLLENAHSLFRQNKHQEAITQIDKAIKSDQNNHIYEGERTRLKFLINI